MVIDEEIFQVGQRVANRFSVDDRVFLAGDAVHTHSPKAGQGMNVSIQDTYNLGWKIAAVVKGIAKRSILKTYQTERRVIAQDLIAFDHKFSRLFSGRPAKDAADETGISVEELKEVFRKGIMFTAGLAVDYGASPLVAKSGALAVDGDGITTGFDADSPGKVVGKQKLAMNIPLGKRFPSHRILNQSDARPWHLGHRLRSDGRFRVVVFAGNLSDSQQLQRVERFGHEISRPTSFLHRFTPSSTPIDSVIEVLTIHSAPRITIQLLDLPDIFHPFDPRRGWDYEKVFVDDESYHEGHGHAYRNYGVDPERGCVVVARPDQHVGWIGELEDVPDMESYFSQFLIPQA